MEITQGARFDSMGLSQEMLRALEKKGYEVSTPIQAGCIPPMMDWQDVTAKAPTGTGKTFAFGIPIIEHIDPESEAVQAVILAPTRELAMQITGEMRDLAQFKPGIRLVCLYGGQPIGKQIDTLKKRPQIVVATPGRLGDHMKRRTVRIDTAQTVILDEADRMLDMGFIHEVTRLLDHMKNRKNLGLFSATISREVMDIAWVYQRDPVEITVRPDEENKPDILQYKLEVPMNQKVDALQKILDQEQYDRAMVFCNTKGNTERVAKLLQMRGVDAQCIHGDIPQEKREKVMAKFRRGSCVSSWPPTWPPGASTWTTWTRCSTTTCPTRTSTTSTASAAPAGPSATGWPTPSCPTTRVWCAWRTSPSTPETTSSPSSLTSPAAWPPTTAEGGRETKRSTYPCRKSTAPS